MRPHICAVHIHKDGDIAHNPNLAVPAVIPQRAPLLVEEELDHLFNRQFAAIFVHHLRQCVVLPARIFLRPLVPTGVVIISPQHIEHRIVGQPRDIVLAEFVKPRTFVIVRALEKVRRRLFNQRQLQKMGRAKIRRSVMSRQPRNPLRRDPSLLHQHLEADQHGVPRKRRQRRIRRAPIPRRTQRQHLPQTLFRRRKKIDKRIRRRPKVPNPAVRRQRRHMQQNT